MKYIIRDTDGNTEKEFKDGFLDNVEIYTAVTIEGLANERGNVITVHGSAYTKIRNMDNLRTLIVRSQQ